MARRLRARLSDDLTKALGMPVNVTQEDVDIANALSEGSLEAAKHVQSYVRNIARHLDLDAQNACKESEPKRLYRIFYKAVSQYDKHIQSVPDIGRMRLLIESPDDIQKLREMLIHRGFYKGRCGQLKEANPTNEISLKEFEDYYWQPSSTGRIGIHISLGVTIRGKQEVPFEIQVLHKDMLDAEEFTRDNYLQAQKIRRAAQVDNRTLSDQDKDAIESYNRSSQERYTADALKYGLFDLRRPDLANPFQRDSFIYEYGLHDLAYH